MIDNIISSSANKPGTNPRYNSSIPTYTPKISSNNEYKINIKESIGEK